MNISESHTLRRLDEVVYTGRTAAIDTQFGEIIVHPTRIDDFCAEIIDINNWKRIAFGATPSIAFLQLACLVKEACTGGRQ